MADDTSRYDRGTRHRFSERVPRELVHRRSISEVFLTGINKTGDKTYILSAQWPRWHVFFGSVGHGYDSALVVETLRQLTVLIAHTQLQVPLGTQFLMPDISVSMTPGAVQDPSRPAEVTAEVRVSEIRVNGPRVTAFRTDAAFLVDGKKIADGTAGARMVDPEAYNRIRSRRSVAAEHRVVTPPVSTAYVGHTSARNVVLGQSPDVANWPLRVDVTNPILFDHPLDHVPGVLLIEAVRQAARLALLDPCLDFSTVDAQFLSIVEFNDEAAVVLECITDGAESKTLHASIRASGHIRMRATISITRQRDLSLVSTGNHQRRLDGTRHADLRENPHA